MDCRIHHLQCLLLGAVLAMCVIGLLCLYAIYYYVFCVGRPRVVCSDRRTLRALRRHCPALFEPYWPTAWAPQAHMQTVIRVATQGSPWGVQGRREVLRMADGGHVCLDWFNESDSDTTEPSSDRPTVLMLPGATGSSKESYIQHWIDDVNKLGCRSVVFNYRGCGNTKVSTPRLYCMEDLSDLTEAVDHIHATLPSSTIIAVGTSMGSIQLILYVAQWKREDQPCPIRAVLVFSVIWDFLASDKALHTNLFNSHVLSRFLTVRYTGIMRENRTVFEEAQSRGELRFDLQTALKSKNLRELNDSCIVYMFNYCDTKESVRQASSPCQKIRDLTVPVVAVNSADDPFTPVHVIPEEVARRNPNLVLVTTRRGGHIGFMQGLFPFGKNYMDTVVVQVLGAMLQHNCLPVMSTDTDSIESHVHTLPAQA